MILLLYVRICSTAVADAIAIDRLLGGVTLYAVVVSWLGRWTCDREVAGSTPGRCIAG